MNIWDLAVGETCRVLTTGNELRVIGDSKERRPMLGVVLIRIAIDKDGNRQKFIYGCEVERVSVASPESK